MKSFFKSYYHIILCVFPIVWMIYLYFFSNVEINHILKNSKYTVTVITSDWHTKSGFKSFGIDYEYHVDGKLYIKQTLKKLMKSQKYLLVFDSLNPQNARILEMYPLYDSINLPENGWTYKQVPISIDSIQIKEYVEKYK